MDKPAPASPVSQESQFKTFAFSMSADADARKRFYEAATKFIESFGQAKLEEMTLELEDLKSRCEINRQIDFARNYEFRFNKKFSTTAIFIGDQDTNIPSFATIQFKGRKAKEPTKLVFLVEVKAPPNANPDEVVLPEPYTTEVDEDLARRWLSYGMIK